MDNQELLHAISSMMDKKLGAWIGARFDGVDARFDKIEKRLDGMDARFDTMEKRLDGMDARFDTMEKRLDGMDVRFDKMEKRLDGMDVRFDTIEKRQNGMDLRLEKVESYVSALRYGQIEIHKELKNLSARVESTYKLALDAWGQSTENRNLLEVSR